MPTPEERQHAAERRQQMAAQYAANWTIQEIADYHHIGYTRTRNLLAQAGVRFRRKGNRPSVA